LEDSGSLAQLLWPTLVELARPAREKRRLDPDARDRLILELCGRAALSVRELADLMDRTEAYVGDAIRPLVDAHRLIFQYPDQPRHPRQRYLTAGSDASATAALIRTHAARKLDDSRTSPSNNDAAALVWEELERIARPARDKRRLPPHLRDNLIVAMCGRAPLSVRELALLLNRSEAYIADAVQPLVSSERLSFLYPDQPRHPRQRYAARWTDVPVTDFDDTAQSGEPDDARFQPPTDARLEENVEPVGDAADKEPELAQPATRQVYAPAQNGSNQTGELMPTPQTAQAPAGEDTSVTEAGSTLLNARTNWILAGIVGVVLGLTQPAFWPLFAIIASAAIALLHVVTDSVQYRAFRQLDSTRAGTTKFILLKAAFALVEIVVLYLLTAALFG
jgi:predicted transcriptional regulator